MSGPLTGVSANIKSAYIKNCERKYLNNKFNRMPPISLEKYVIDVDNNKKQFII